MNWKTLSSKYLFRRDWLTLREDECLRPDGKIISPYYVYEFPEWVAALALTKDNKVILVKQYRHALGETLLELPGGCVDASDQSYEEAIARELMEETGYKFDKIEYLCKTSANPSTNNNLLRAFLATGGEKVANQKLDEGEDIEVHLYSIDEIKQLLRENKFMQSMHVTALFYGLEKLNELKY